MDYYYSTGLLVAKLIFHSRLPIMILIPIQLSLIACDIRGPINIQSLFTYNSNNI